MLAGTCFGSDQAGHRSGFAISAASVVRILSNETLSPSMRISETTCRVPMTERYVRLSVGKQSNGGRHGSVSSMGARTRFRFADPWLSDRTGS